LTASGQWREAQRHDQIRQPLPIGESDAQAHQGWQVIDALPALLPFRGLIGLKGAEITELGAG